MENKPISIGIENYKEIIDKKYYYIDKTSFIKDLLDKGGKVNVFTRPRRFGKTLALSMVKTYFEKEMNLRGEVIDNSHYFKSRRNICWTYGKISGNFIVFKISQSANFSDGIR